MKVGIFGGTFDPVHFGHLSLVIALKELCALDEVLLVPAGISPFKENAPPFASNEHRLAMLSLAVASMKGFHIIDWELSHKGPSYTIDTVRKLSQENSNELHLLLSDDQVSNFYLWKKADELARLAPPLIGTRQGGEVLQIPHAKKIITPIFEISSSLIRERLRKKMYCGHLLPSSVLDYIAQHRLY